MFLLSKKAHKKEVQALPANCTILHQGMVFDGGKGERCLMVERGVCREINMALSFCIYSYMS